jgi:uncharacterized membrane protein YebE (DUF533 family)
MFDPERLLGQMLGDALGGAMRGPKRGKRKSSRGISGMAGKAQLGVGLLGIAMAAWEHYSQKSPTNVPAGGGVPPPPPPMSPTPPPPPPATASTRAMPRLDARQQDMVLLIRTMIAAANADGHIDARERDTILGHARAGGLDAETLAFLQDELARPQTLEQLIGIVRPQLAAETYAAAALAIDVDTESERLWLERLARALELSPATRADIDARLAQG